MKLPKQILIEKACSGDAERPVLNSVYLALDGTGPNGPACLLATNGRIAAVVPVMADPSDTAGYVTADALKAARKCAGKLETAAFSANVVLKMLDGQEFARPDHGRYPNMDAAIPKDETKWSVSLDPELLYSLAQAIGASRGVTLEFCGEGKAVRVKPMLNPRAETAKGAHAGYAPACVDALGLIMPIAQPNK